MFYRGPSTECFDDKIGKPLPESNIDSITADKAFYYISVDHFNKTSKLGGSIC